MGTEESPAKLDAASRRRLQNRLNQRASRKRRALNHGQSPKRKWVFYTGEATPCTPHEGIQNQMEATCILRPANSNNIEDTGASHFCAATQLRREQFWTQLQAHVIHGMVNNLYSFDFLLLATQFNILRAMFVNAATMGLTMEVLSEDIASHFNTTGPMTFHLPPSLQPSSTQKQIIHHPWIDLIPISSLRNTLLSRRHQYDEEELCTDLYGLCGGSSEVGLVVWGEAWDPTAYEFSEPAVKKWSWMLKQCPEILVSTNYWREKRGEKPLRFDGSSNLQITEVEE
ncbi:uncharacterized protein N7459_003373 [Penicillium hispanicum]|uniref:uncharacterized protein n=1 Tax=Penicillium hispanicum TaxID=1080232 RepID=UPI0025403F5F|nr:uncharacterized protein N7459_003373 [Penicillium hispanicum]KAJ5587608.1 hypothetical protein N7459_003373 [Penicillium hispanicum]